MMRITLLFFAVFLLGEARSNPSSGPPPSDSKDDECRPSPPDPQNSVVCCADAPEVFEAATNTSLEKIFEVCRSEVETLQGNPGGPSLSDDESMGPSLDFDCISECLFKNLNLLDSKNNLDQGIIKKLMIATHTGDWAAVGTKASESCFSTSSSQIPKESKCKSGAEEFMNCFTRITFLNCPSSKWKSDETCKKLKARVEKCPNYDTISLL